MHSIKMILVICVGCIFAAPSAFATVQPTSAVGQGAGVVTPKGEEGNLPAIAADLNTEVQRDMSKQTLLNMLKTADIVYLNTHIYYAEGMSGIGHPIDRWVNKYGGSIAVGEISNFSGNADSVIQQSEVTAALAEKGSPKLVIISGCSAAKYNWGNVFKPFTVIDFNSGIEGYAADVFFQHFFDSWTKQGTTVAEALSYADNMMNDELKKRGMGFKYWALKMQSERRVHGNTSLKYRQTKSLQDDWIPRGMTNEGCKITNTGQSQISAVTEKGATGAGHYVDSTAIEVEFPSGNLLGEISDDGKKIHWSNTDDWVRGISEVSLGDWKVGDTAFRTAKCTSDTAVTKTGYSKVEGWKAVGRGFTLMPQHGSLTGLGKVGWVYRSVPNYHGPDKFSVILQLQSDDGAATGKVTFIYDVTVL